MEHITTENIAEALRLLDEAAKHKREELTTAMADKYTNLRGLIADKESSFLRSLANAKEHALEAAAHAKDVSVEKAREIAHDVDKNAHQHPWVYIAGSAAVGLLLGYILGRRRD